MFENDEIEHIALLSEDRSVKQFCTVSDGLELVAKMKTAILKRMP